MSKWMRWDLSLSLWEKKWVLCTTQSGVGQMMLPCSKQVWIQTWGKPGAVLSPFYTPGSLDLLIDPLYLQVGLVLLQGLVMGRHLARSAFLRAAV